MQMVEREMAKNVGTNSGFQPQNQSIIEYKIVLVAIKCKCLTVFDQNIQLIS